jgi:hypothetical protein
MTDSALLRACFETVLGVQLPKWLKWAGLGNCSLVQVIKSAHLLHRTSHPINKPQSMSEPQSTMFVEATDYEARHYACMPYLNDRDCRPSPWRYTSTPQARLSHQTVYAKGRPSRITPDNEL